MRVSIMEYVNHPPPHPPPPVLIILIDIDTISRREV